MRDQDDDEFLETFTGVGNLATIEHDPLVRTDTELASSRCAKGWDIDSSVLIEGRPTQLLDAVWSEPRVGLKLFRTQRYLLVRSPLSVFLGMWV